MDDLLPHCYSPYFMSPFPADGHHQNPAPESVLSCDDLEKWSLGNDDVLMDDLLPPCYSPYFVSPFSADGHHQNPGPEAVLPCDDLEKLLLGNDDVLDNHEDDEDPHDTTRSSLPPPAAAAAAPLAKRKRGREPGSGSRAAGTTTATHVEAERQRRDRFNRLFCDLRAAVPTVTRLDRASLLADAIDYITKLRGRVEQLEAEAEAAEARQTTAASLSQLPILFGGSGQELEVRTHGRDVAEVRLTTTAVRHAPARLMAALRALDLPVLHASVCRVGGVTMQDVVVDMAAATGLWGENCLRAALLHKLLQESG